MASITRTRKTAEQKKHEHYHSLVVLLRQCRIHRMVLDGEHAEHTFENGEHVDFYASSTYTGFAYMVVYGVQGYECGCKSYEHRRSCEHTKDAAARSAARYHEAQRQHELAVAAQVAPLVLGEKFSEDLQVHAVDALASQEVPVAVWDGEGAYAYVLVGDLVEPVYGGSLDHYYPKHIVGEPLVYGLEVQRRLDANLVVERISYRDLYPADFN